MSMRLMFHRNDGTGLGWFVKTFERGSEYDHVELEFSDGVSFSCVANEGLRNYGVRKRVIQYQYGEWDYITMPHTKLEEMLTRGWAEGSIGKGYDLLSLMLYLPFALKGAANLYICSEWCEEAISYNSAGLFKGLDSGTLKSPTKLANALVKCGLTIHPVRA